MKCPDGMKVWETLKESFAIAIAVDGVRVGPRQLSKGHKRKAPEVNGSRAQDVHHDVRVATKLQSGNAYLAHVRDM